jgi:choline transport protein
MNYNSVIIVGVVALTALWWLLHAVRHYPGPKVMTLYIHDDEVQGEMIPPEQAESGSEEKKVQ